MSKKKKKRAVTQIARHQGNTTQSITLNRCELPESVRGHPLFTVAFTLLNLRHHGKLKIAKDASRKHTFTDTSGFLEHFARTFLQGRYGDLDAI